MPTAPVNGTLLEYDVVGEDGPTCLVLHGWPGADHTYLRPGLDPLAQRLRLVYYDHRCHGRSGRPSPSTLTVEQLADDADQLAASLGTGPVLVLGHYQGAVVAQELALRHPGRVAGLVLVAATPGELGKEESLADGLDETPRPPEVEVLHRVPPGSDEELGATLQALTPFFFHRVGTAERERPFARAVLHAEAAVQASLVLGWWSSVDRLPEIKAPTLLLAGRHDVFASPFQAARIARHVPSATTVVLEEGGHLPWVEEPDAFLAAVDAWLDEAAAAGA